MSGGTICDADVAIMRHPARIIPTQTLLPATRLAALFATLLVTATACAAPQSSAGPKTATQPPQTSIYATAEAALAAEPEPASRGWLLYLHGAILEAGDRRPTHPERGTYEYDEILATLASTGLVVISELRGPTEPETYARHVADEVRSLIDAGVAPERITVVGFSKGGGIALLANQDLMRDDVAFVFIASCGPWLDRRSLSLHGRLLSIFEESDSLGSSCADAVARSSTEPEAFEEIETHLGGGHGAFFRPQSAWIEPVLAWAGAPL